MKKDDREKLANELNELRENSAIARGKMKCEEDLLEFTGLRNNIFPDNTEWTISQFVKEGTAFAYPLDFYEDLEKMRNRSRKMDSIFNAMYYKIFEDVKKSKDRALKAIETLNEEFNKSDFKENVMPFFEVNYNGLVERLTKFFGYNKYVVRVEDNIKKYPDESYFVQDMEILSKTFKPEDAKKTYRMKDILKEIDENKLIVLEDKNSRAIKGTFANLFAKNTYKKVKDVYVPKLKNDTTSYSNIYNSVLENEMNINKDYYANYLKKYVLTIGNVTEEAEKIYSQAIKDKENELSKERQSVLRKEDWLKAIKRNHSNRNKTK